MEITLLIDSLGFGGAQRQIANLAVALKQKGHKINFLQYRKDNFYASILQKAEIVPVVIDSTNFINRALQIRKAIRSLEQDVVIAFLGMPSFYACVASCGFRKWKLITSERNANVTTFTSTKQKLLKRFQLHCSDMIVNNSKCAQGLWAKYVPKSKDKLTTIYNIIDVPNQEATPAEDGISRILVAGRYEEQKNLLGMIAGVNLLSEEERNKLEIHWYGKANVSNAASSIFARGCDLIRANHLEHCVFLHPATDQIHDLMAQSDYVALFSHFEGLPNAIIEGMSLKRPVIMSKVSDYQVLVDERNGFVCDPSSTQDIAKAIEAAIHTTYEQRNVMGQQSCDRIQSICSREVVVEQWLRLIEDQ